MQKSLGHCCFCFPMKFGLAMVCMWHLLFSFVCIINIFNHNITLQSGGYNPHTNHLQIWVGAFGIVFALSGLIGIYDNCVSWVKWYNRYQFIKLATLAVVFLADLSTLISCVSWSSRMRSQVSYNPALDSISRHGLCEWVLVCYTMGFLMDFTCNAYWCYISLDFCNQMETCPAYLILFPGKDQHHLQVTHVAHKEENPTCLLMPRDEETDFDKEVKLMKKQNYQAIAV